MVVLNGGRGRGFASNVNGSDAQLREEILQSLGLINAQMAGLKSDILAFQDIARVAPIVVQHINADSNLSPSELANLQTLNRMVDDINRLSKSFEEIQDMAQDIAGRL